MSINMRFSKTDTLGEGKTFTLGREASDLVKWYKDSWTEIPEEGVVLSVISNKGTPVWSKAQSYDLYRKELGVISKRLGFSKFTPHCGRIGGGTVAGDIGVRRDHIRRAGLWAEGSRCWIST